MERFDWGWDDINDKIGRNNSHASLLDHGNGVYTWNRCILFRTILRLEPMHLY